MPNRFRFFISTTVPAFAIANKKACRLTCILIALLSCIISASDGGDFDVYLDAADKLKRGLDIYAPPFAKGLQYYYSVFFALLLRPGTKHVFAIEVIWQLLSCYWLYRCWKLILRHFLGLLTAMQETMLLLGALFFSLQFIMYNISLIQVTIFLLWASLESLCLFEKGRNISGGLLLSLAININIMPLILLAYLFYRGFWRGLLCTTAGLFLFLFIPTVFIGEANNIYLLHSWWNIINPQNAEHLFETGLSTHSIVSLLPSLLLPTHGEMQYRRNILHLSVEHVELIILFSRLLLLGLSLFFFKSLPFKREKNPLKTFWEIAYFLLIIPLIMPNQPINAFLFALPMFIYLFYFLIVSYPESRTVSYKLKMTGFLLHMFFFSPIYGSDVIGTFLFDLTQHYKMLTYASLMLIPLSISCNPNKLQTDSNYHI